MSDTTPTAAKFAAPDFNSEKYVKELTLQNMNSRDLQEQRQKIQALAEEANSQLKKNVYQNYMQFIEAAKEISYLESEMYQLSHMLTEQKALLSSLLETSLQSEKVQDGKVKETKTEEKDGRRKLVALLEKIEGCGVVLEVPGRILIREGDLLELDSIENTPLQRVRGCLLNDCFFVANYIGSRGSPNRFRFEKLYELEVLAVVNIKDVDNIKHAFKILSSDTRVFQCSTAQSKKDWMEAFEGVRQIRKDQEKQKRESMIMERPHSQLSKTDSFDSTNPFSEKEEMDSQSNILETLQDFSEELDVHIAQRAFEEAVEIIFQVRKEIQNATSFSLSDSFVKDAKQKLDLRVKMLIESLTNELKVTPNKSLRGGPRAARRILLLLVQLGQAHVACDLFLKLRSLVLKNGLQNLKLEGDTASFLGHMGTIFFSNMLETGKEFMNVFAQCRNCAPAFVCWAKSEMESCMSSYCHHLSTTKSSLSLVATCVADLRSQCEELCEVGLELGFVLDSILRPKILQALPVARDKALESLKLRSQEETWTPINLSSSKPSQQNLLSELNELGLSEAQKMTSPDGSQLCVAAGVVAFGKSFLVLEEDMMKVVAKDTKAEVDTVLHDVFQAQLQQVENVLRSGSISQSKVLLVQKSKSFLLDMVLPVAEKKYEGNLHVSHPSLHRLRDDFSRLKDAPRTVSRTKYSTSNYL